jgi:aminomethyltransferase
VDLTSPLADRTAALGARTASFGGWEMPLSYRGVVEEHLATRSTVGVFDVSHLGKIGVSGEGALDLVDRCLTNDLSRIGAGQAQYTLVCDDETGGVVDDLIVYRVADDDLLLVPNAANTAAVLDILREQAPDSVTVTDRHRELATIAVQGPRSAAVLDAVGLPSGMAYMGFVQVERDGAVVTVCRTGYTGEHGYEVLPPADAAGPLWDALLDAATAAGGQPAGLGARDTLRTEMGYPLHGQDLTPSVTPLEARLGWAVGWDKPAFRGQEVLVREREVGAPRRLWGLRSADRGIPRPHMPVTTADDVDLGEVTSGTFSPTLKVGIALALLSRAVGDGDEVRVDVRGRPSVMTVVTPPFVASSVR